MLRAGVAATDVTVAFNVFLEVDHAQAIAVGQHIDPQVREMNQLSNVPYTLVRRRVVLSRPSKERNNSLNSAGSTPSAAITARTIGSESISSSDNSARFRIQNRLALECHAPLT